MTDTDHDELRTLADKLDDIAQRAEVEHISGVRPALRKWDTDRLRVAAAVLRDDLRRRQRAYLATQRLTAERDAAVAELAEAQRQIQSLIDSGLRFQAARDAAVARADALTAAIGAHHEAIWSEWSQTSRSIPPPADVELWAHVDIDPAARFAAERDRGTDR